MNIRLVVLLIFCSFISFPFTIDAQSVDHFFLELEDPDSTFSMGFISAPDGDYINTHYSGDITSDQLIDSIAQSYAEQMNEKSTLTIYIHGMMAHRQKFQTLHNNVFSPKLYERDDYHSHTILSLVWYAGFDYHENVASAIGSGIAFAPVIDKLYTSLLRLNPKAEIDIINHSMGNRTFEGLYLALDSIESKVYFDDVVFAAADLPTDIFEQGESLEKISKRAGHSYVLRHNKDVTLGASKYLNKADRLGLGGPPNVAEKADYLTVIDCSKLRDNEKAWFNYNNHRYFYSSPTSRESIFQLIVDKKLILESTPLDSLTNWLVLEEMGKE